MKKIIPKGEPIIPTDAERVFEGVLFDVYHWQQKMFDGSSQTFEALKRADSALTIGIDESNKLIMIQDAQPHKRTTVRLPGGRVDYTDSSTLEAAKREMREETGYVFNDWRLVHVGRVTSKLDWFIYYYLASDVKSHAKPTYDTDGEKISVMSLSYNEALDTVVHEDEYSLLHKIGSLEALRAMPEYEGEIVEVEPKKELLDR